MTVESLLKTISEGMTVILKTEKKKESWTINSRLQCKKKKKKKKKNLKKTIVCFLW